MNSINIFGFKTIAAIIVVAVIAIHGGQAFNEWSTDYSAAKSSEINNYINSNIYSK